MRQPGVKAITEDERGLMAMPPIQSFLPVVFENCNEIGMIDGYCAWCNERIPPDFMRGRVTRPIKQVVVIEAVGICEDCKVATPFFWRIYDDLRLSTIQGGSWVTFRPKRPLLSRAGEALRGWLSGGKK